MSDTKKMTKEEKNQKIERQIEAGDMRETAESACHMQPLMKSEI